jgi:hypothetical protein
MRRMANETDVMRSIIRWFVDRIEDMRLDDNDYETAMNVLLQEMFQRYKKEQTS